MQLTEQFQNTPPLRKRKVRGNVVRGLTVDEWHRGIDMLATAVRGPRSRGRSELIRY